MAGALSQIPSSSLKPIAGDETDTAADKYKSEIERIKAALDARQANNSQQMLLAITAGMLTPGPTGGFGESVGHAAGNLAKVQQAQEGSVIEDAKMRLQLAQAEREQALKNQSIQFLRGNKQEGAPSNVTQGNKSGLGVMINGIEVTPDLIALKTIENPELGKALQTQYELTLKGIQVQPGGYVNILSGKYTPFGGKAMVTRNVPGVGVVDMPEQDAIELDEARRAGDTAKFYEVVKRNTMPLGKAGEKKQPREGEEAPVAEKPEKPETPMTKSSIEAQSAALKKEAEEGATSRAKQTSAVRDAGKAAIGLIPIYDRADSILNRPGLNFNKMMGVLEKGGALDAIGSLVEEALRVGNFSVGIPAIRKIIAETGAPPELIAAASEFGQLLAMIQFEQRKGLGSGTSVSTFEQMMVNAMGPSMRDTLMGLKPKLQFMRNKAEFERDMAKALRKSGMQYEDFEDTPEFEKMFNDYRNRQMSVAYGASAVAKPSAGGASAPPAPGAKITADDIRSRLGIKK